METAPPSPYLSPKELSKWLGVTLRTVYNWIEQGHVPAIKIGHTLRIKRDDVTGAGK